MAKQPKKPFVKPAKPEEKKGLLNTAVKRHVDRLANKILGKK
jgi:hypothetical protein